MKIIEMDLEDLHAAEYNPRQISNEALEGLMEVLKIIKAHITIK